MSNPFKVFMVYSSPQFLFFVALNGQFRRFAYFFVISPFLLFSCKNDPFETKTAFYHWQSNADITDAEYEYMKNVGAERLYVRLFDVIWGNDGPQPLARLSVDELQLEVKEIVPVIYFKERVLRQLRADGVDSLADRVLSLMQAYLPDLLNPDSTLEIQFDCDWASQSKAEYFLFLKTFKKHLPKSISVSTTLRLHQFKDPEGTGIPPCDRATLMLYNTGDVTDFSEENSLLRYEDARIYIEGAKPYPLPLDVAVPIYDWLVIHRDSLFFKIVYPPDFQLLADTFCFQKTDDTHWTVKQPVQFSAHYLHPEDVLRWERSEAEAIEKTLSLLRPKLVNIGQHHLIFYHLDTAVIDNFEAEYLKELSVLK